MKMYKVPYPVHHESAKLERFAADPSCTNAEECRQELAKRRGDAEALAEAERVRRTNVLTELAG